MGNIAQNGCEVTKKAGHSQRQEYEKEKQNEGQRRICDKVAGVTHWHIV
jgi:hypothetical protein